MALKDAIDKIVSYFDTDEVTDYEDAAKEEAKERPVKARPVKVQRPVQTPPPRQQRQPERSQATVPPRRQHVNSDLQETQVLRSLPLSRSQANQGPQQMNTTKTTIAIKYPKKYEDAQEIVAEFDKYYDPEYDRFVDEEYIKEQYESFKSNYSWFNKSYEQFKSDNFTLYK